MRHIQIFLAFVFSLLAGPALAATFNLNADFSSTTNPNGPWTYREGTNALPLVSDWTPLTATAVQPAWAPSATSGSFLPAWFKSTTDNPAGLDILGGDVVVHTTDSFNGAAYGVANVIWTSPSAGLIDLSGNAWMARDIGRSNSWSLALNGRLPT